MGCFIAHGLSVDRLSNPSHSPNTLKRLPEQLQSNVANMSRSSVQPIVPIFFVWVDARIRVQHPC